MVCGYMQLRDKPNLLNVHAATNGRREVILHTLIRRALQVDADYRTVLLRNNALNNYGHPLSLRRCIMLIYSHNASRLVYL